MCICRVACVRMSLVLESQDRPVASLPLLRKGRWSHLTERKSTGAAPFSINVSNTHFFFFLPSALTNASLYSRISIRCSFHQRLAQRTNFSSFVYSKAFLHSIRRREIQTGSLCCRDETGLERVAYLTEWVSTNKK